MKRSLISACMCLAALLRMPGVAGAADGAEPWRFDLTRSAIDFQLSAIGFVPIAGSFESFAGEIWRDSVDGHLRVAMRIDATSLAMASDRYRNWARSREFFDVRRHPEIAFTSGPVSDGLLVDGGKLAGTLRLRGIERRVEFQVETGACTHGLQRCELHVVGEINRRQFGMTSRRLTLSDRVTLDMKFVAFPARRTAPTVAGKAQSPTD